MDRYYSIKDLELLSGIKAHTIRIWEQRYDLFHPLRTETNIRQYTDEDLKLILNIAILNKKGFKISKIASFKKEEVEREAYRILATDQDSGIQMDGLRHAMITLDEEEFNRVFANLTMRYGFEEAMIRVVYPFLELVGVLWQTNTITPLHEHFASSIIRQKIIVAQDMLPVPKKDTAGGFVLACPQDEFHELGLLFANYMMRSRGVHTIYLGANVPEPDMTAILKESGIRNILVSVVVTPSAVDLPEFVDGIRHMFPEDVHIYLTGRQVAEAELRKLPERCAVLARIDDLAGLLDRI